MTSDLQLTASNIKYLLALAQLDDANNGVHCTELAVKLGVTKPSIHNMVRMLSARGLTTKKRYGTVCLTEDGRRISTEYRKYYARILTILDFMLGFTSAEIDACIYALLSAVPIKRLEAICTRTLLH